MMLTVTYFTFSTLSKGAEPIGRGGLDRVRINGKIIVVRLNI